MKIRKIAAGILSLAMLASFAGCGSTSPQTSTGGNNASYDDDDDNGGGNAGGNSGGNSGGEMMNGGAPGDGDGLNSDGTAPGVPSLTELYGDQTINLTVYSQLANYSGELTGWFAELIKQKFNAVLTIIPDSDGTYDTRMASGNLGDIVVFGSNGKQYKQAAAAGMLFDWNEDEILSDYGPYIKAHMPYALENNMKLNAGDEIGKPNTVYGFGHNVASSPEDHEAFFYTMDIRWDLYKELGYPELNNLDDFYNMLVEMKKICPVDEMGNPTYAVSLWPDWDGWMVMYVKSFATCYWGYEGDMGMGHYDADTGEYWQSYDEGSPYLKSLKFFNKLYQADLIDPNSMTQTYAQMSEKVQNGGTFFSIFDYAGSAIYNTEDHLNANKAMCSFVPKDSTPAVYGMNVLGGNRLWTIGAATDYPELCMAIINYLCTPEGYMTYNYGPKDVCWYYDENKHCCLTELGESAKKDRKGTIMPPEWGGISFDEGTCQINNTTWSIDASNPESAGESYNAENWASRRSSTEYAILQDWRDFTGCYNTQEYMNTTNYKIIPATSYAESSKSDDLELLCSQIKDTVVNYSWQAIYAKTDAEYDRIVEEMVKKCNEYDPNGLTKEWCLNEAKIRHQLEIEVTK